MLRVLKTKILKEVKCLFRELYVKDFVRSYLVDGTAVFLVEQLQLNRIRYILNRVFFPNKQKVTNGKLFVRSFVEIRLD